MARIYATPEQLAEWTGIPAPSNAVGLLRYASSLVERATRTALYPTTSEGLPSLPEIANTFRGATSAQAGFWAANDLDPAVGPLKETGKRVATSKTIKGASVTYDAADTARAKQARVDAINTLCEEAWNILDNAGLINTPPRAY